MIKRLILAVAALCAVSGAGAQVPVAPIVQPHVTFVNASGGPCAGCKLYSYSAGTTTPFPTYTDSIGISQNPNPIILDASGGPQTPSGSSGGIWLGLASYKLILKDALGATIWTVDNVKGGGGLGGVCGPAGAIQIANIGVTGLTCDSAIFVNTTNHTFNVGTIGPAHVVIGPLGTPTLWTFDTTTPATALASLGGGMISPGTINQIAIYPAAGNNIQGSSAIPAGITATTQTPSDNSAKLATTAYVALPGAINPTSVQIASGTAMTDNQGNGTKIQHSTGAPIAGNFAKFDVNGNVVDSGASGASVVPRTCNANGCYRVEGDGTIVQWGVASGCATSSGHCTVFVTFPTTFTTTVNLSIQATCAGSAANCTANIASGASTSGFTLQYGALVFIGGAGGETSGSQSGMWKAIGY